MTLAILLLLIGLPDPHLTPGAVRPLSQAQVCAIHWSTDTRRVTQRMKRQVAAHYQLAWPATGYVFDHLIPRDLGGADVIENLWPQTVAEAKRKDGDEVRLHRAVCATPSRLSLEAAQQQMRQWGRPQTGKKG